MVADVYQRLHVRMEEPGQARLGYDRWRCRCACIADVQDV